MTALAKLTKDQLADRLGVSTRQLEVLVTRGELPEGTRIGRQVFWLEAIAEMWERRQFAEQMAWVNAFR
jgi:prophage regulatory protein